MSGIHLLPGGFRELDAAPDPVAQARAESKEALQSALKQSELSGASLALAESLARRVLRQRTPSAIGRPGLPVGTSARAWRVACVCGHVASVHGATRACGRCSCPRYLDVG